jgi:hypothetical protein
MPLVIPVTPAYTENVSLGELTRLGCGRRLRTAAIYDRLGCLQRPHRMTSVNPVAWGDMRESVFVESLKKAISVREMVVSKYNWFVHDTGYAKLGDVRANGLVLRNYESFEIPEQVKNYLGEDRCGILCFYPNGADLRPQSSQPAPHMRVAIPERRCHR